MTAPVNAKQRSLPGNKERKQNKIFLNFFVGSSSIPFQIEETLCFYLGSRFQSHPPTPSDQRLFVQNRQELTVYTRFFKLYFFVGNLLTAYFFKKIRNVSGWMSPSAWQNERDSLGQLVQQ